MLLVDSSKHIFWTYPAPGATPAMPFRFDDDTFFGPRVDRIISNQEDQHTIQIISFPGSEDPLALRPRQSARLEPRLPAHARRRIPVAERPRHGCRRLQLPRSLHQPRAQDRAPVRHDGRLQAQPSVASSARSTAPRHFPTAARSSARSTAHGSTTSARTADCAGRCKRPCRTRPIRNCSGPAGSCSRTTRSQVTRSS